MVEAQSAKVVSILWQRNTYPTLNSKRNTIRCWYHIEFGLSIREIKKKRILSQYMVRVIEYMKLASERPDITIRYRLLRGVGG
jgi:hypothetical protein